MFTVKKWCGVYIKNCFYSVLQKYAFSAVIGFFFWIIIIDKIKEKCLIKIIYVPKLFLIVLCPHKDKLVLHCMKDILIYFWVEMKFHAMRLWGIKNFY